MLIGALVLAGCSSDPPLNQDVSPLDTSHDIVYQLGGTADTADITVSAGDGGTSQQQGVDVPLTNKNGTAGLRYTVGAGTFLYLSAQNNGSGTLTCEIREDGVVVASQQSSGEYSIVTCEATA